MFDFTISLMTCTYLIPDFNARPSSKYIIVDDDFISCVTYSIIRAAEEIPLFIISGKYI